MGQLTMFLTVMMLPTVFVAILSILNGIALVYQTVNYIPFLVIVKVFFIWMIISVPLCVIGTLAGRHANVTSADFPCRVNAIARPIPEDVPFHGKPMNLIPFAGLLSFGSIFIELYLLLHVQDSDDGFPSDHVLFWLHDPHFFDIRDAKRNNWAFCSKQICANYFRQRE